jgi:hypothetical protein
VNVSELRSLEMEASMKTRRALEWKAWLEKPRSISDTAATHSVTLSAVKP